MRYRYPMIRRCCDEYVPEVGVGRERAILLIKKDQT